MEKGTSSGQMAGNMKGSTAMEKNRVMDSFSGTMGGSIEVNGRIANKTEEGSSLGRTALRGREYGAMAKRSAGLTDYFD
jgi:hypothetical protein